MTLLKIKNKLLLQCDNELCKSSFERKKRQVHIDKKFHFCSFKCSRKAMLKGGVLYKQSQETSIKKYGSTHHMKNDEQKSKVQNTNLKKYGVKQVLASATIREKIIKTNIEKYGVSNPMQNEKIKSIVSNTNNSKTKDEWDAIKDKRKKTSLKNYGVEYPSQAKEIKDKISKSSIGKKMSFEAKEKMSEARKLMIGKKHPCFGKPRPDMQGENNPNWNGGISSIYKKIRQLSAYKEWRTACFKRDNWTCVHCSKTKCELFVDHIKPFALIVCESNIKEVNDAMKIDELWNIGNGRTLCLECHIKTDTYGQKTKKIMEGLKVGDLQRT